jgi:hypothetical protein
VPRRLRQLVPGHQHLALPWPLPPHRHGWHSPSLFYQQRISRRPDFVNGLLGLRPARTPGLFFPRLRLGSWWPLFYADPTSFSTGIGTGDRRTPNGEPHDDPRAKCGACECR